MPKFDVQILPIDSVTNHPKADRLSLNSIRGYTIVSNKLEDGSHRYRPGQLVALVPPDAEVPVALLQKRGYWDDEKDIGYLGGPRGDIVVPISLRGVISEGIIFPTESYTSDPENPTIAYIENGHGDKRIALAGLNVTAFLGIRKQETQLVPIVDGPYPSTPTLIDPINYEIEDLKKYPDILTTKQVVVTEMLHGVLCIIGYDRRRILKLDNPYFVTSARGGSLGICYKFDSDNIYTQMAKPIWERIQKYLVEMPAVERFYLFGVIIGPGIQDLTYGLETTEFRAIDVQMGLMGGGPDTIPFGFIDFPKKVQLFKWMNIPTVPMLGAGDFDMSVLKSLANAPSIIGGGLRRGIVVTGETESSVNGMRPILKLTSDKFLIRKKGTNFK